MFERDDAETYLQLLFGAVDDGFIEIRPILDSDVNQEFFPASPSPSDDAADHIESVAGRYHAFCGVLPRTNRSGSEDDVETLNAVWADIDVKDFAEGKPSILQQAKSAAPLTPSLIVDSGHGFHFYWLLSPTANIKNRKEKVKKLVKRYHSAVGADYTHDLARILRVPGTPNIKYEDDPVMCSIEEVSGQRYSLRELAHAVKNQPEVSLSDLRDKLPQRVLQRAKNAPQKFADDRSGNDYYVAQQMSRCGFDKDEIKQAFRLFANQGWDSGEKIEDRGDEYVDYLLQETLADKEDRLDSILDSIRDAPEMPEKEVCQACRIISNLPPIKRDIKEHDLQDALGGRQEVSIESIRDRVEVEEQGGQTPNTVPELGRMLMDRREYLNLEGNLYVYNGGVYRKKGQQKIRSDIQDILLGEWSKKKRNDAVEWVKDHTFTEIKEMPENKYLINCKNGVYDLRSDALRDHAPEDRFLWQIDAKYDPGVEHARLDKFMGEVFYEEDIPVLWEHCGYALMPWLTLKKFLILVGKGDNGKSVFLSAVEGALGDESVSHETLRDLTSNKFSTHQLFGKLANICADITADRVKHVEVLKALTGGDSIRAEVKFGRTYQFQNTAKLMFSANKLPRVEVTEAFFNRLHIVRCPNQFSIGEQDPELPSKLTTEEAKSAWLNKAIQGAKRLLRNERFSESERIEQEILEYRKRIDSVTEFIMDSVQQVGGGAFERFTTMYRAYEDWCDRAGRQPVSMQVFEERAQMKPNELEKDTKMLDGNYSYVWKGVKLK